MKRSTERVLTTHIGSLPRPMVLMEAIVAKEQGEALDQATYDAELTTAVADVVQKQADAGIDIVNDGEYGKPSFLTYVNDRLSGFEPSNRPQVVSWANSREALAFPDFYRPDVRPQGTGLAAGFGYMNCTGPIAYKGEALLARDLANLKAALASAEITEAFVPAISISNVEDCHTNEHYASDDDYLAAIADAMHVEYKAIVDAGFLLQIDDPILSTYYIMNPELSVEQCRSWMEKRVEALNHALRGIAEDRIRYHTCYAINMGPRVHDMELKDIVDIMLKVNAGAYSFEAGNPRHEHEWRLWHDIAVPDDKILIPGVITHSTVVVEHPELVAQRLCRFAAAVGREKVIAGADCGFATFASSTPEIHQSIVWAKLEALAEGARLASKTLWQ